MPDLRDRFRALDGLDVPDVMAEVDLIGPKPPSPEPPTAVGRRIVTLVVAVAFAAVGVIVVVRMFEDVSHRPAVRPSVTQTPDRTETTATRPRDLEFVDIHTGRASPLPIGIRMVNGADHFQISPDGRTLAFDDGHDVYLANVNGTNVRKLTEGLTPWWSPDGTRLVCVRIRLFSDATLELVDVASGRTTPILHVKGAIYHPNFSEDGRTILFTLVRSAYGAAGPPASEYIGVWTIDANGRTRPREVPLPESRFNHPAFGTYSPDGQTIAFRMTNYTGVDPTEMTQGVLWLADADGSRARHLGGAASMSQVDPYSLWPMWSPDGRFIAFQRLYNSVITVVDARTGRPVKIDTDKDLGVAARPMWLDDHTLIIRRSGA